MACILCIETSTDVCSVAVSVDHHVIWNEEDHSGPNHAVSLGVYVDQALSYIDHDGLTLDAVAVSCGPGSYTGLRIGVSMAKGVCYGRNAKLIAVPTLDLLCVPVLLSDTFSGADADFSVDGTDQAPLLCPMLDARRMEVYAEMMDRSMKLCREVAADIVDAESYSEWLKTHPVYFFGNGSDKCREVITHENAHFIEGIQPLAKNMPPLAEGRLLRGEVEDVAYFVPFYLKEFQATQPKKLL